MESLRLSYVSSILKSARRIEAKLCYRNNLSVIFRRTNHSLCQQRLITAINHDSPKLFSNFHKYWIVYRLEHGVPATNNLTSVVKDITQSSESLPKSKDSKQMVESISGTGNISEIKENENINILDESTLPPIPDTSVTIIEEVSLKSLGLCGWSPPGIVQQILEFFHTSFGLSWWAAIVASHERVQVLQSLDLATVDKDKTFDLVFLSTIMQAVRCLGAHKTFIDLLENVCRKARAKIQRHTVVPNEEGLQSEKTDFATVHSVIKRYLGCWIRRQRELKFYGVYQSLEIRQRHVTLTLRFFMIPFTIKMRKDMTNYSNHMPQYQHLQNKISEAKRSGTYYEVAQAAQELNQFLLEKKLFSLGMTVPYLVQMPIFISVFFALKRMSETAELKSFETGGIFWFTDLSVPDQFYILPIMTAGTIWLTLKSGSSSHALQSSPFHAQRLIEILTPTVIFLATMHFPAATACYWTTSNIFVLIQNRILAAEPVRKFLDIPKPISNIYFGKTKDPNKGVVDGFKEAYNNMKLTREIEDRERLNAVKFEENASAPTRRTFKFNPKNIPRTEK